MSVFHGEMGEDLDVMIHISVGRRSLDERFQWATVG